MIKYFKGDFMTDRQKIGIAGVISSGLGLFTNIMLVAFTSTPPWVAAVSAIVVAVAGALGYAVSKVNN